MQQPHILLFGVSHKYAKHISLTITTATTVSLLLSVFFVYLGTSWESSAYCSTVCPCSSIEETKECEFVLKSAFSGAVILFTCLCFLVQSIATLVNLCYFLIKQDKGFIAAYLVTQVALFILSQTLWAFILVDIGAENAIGNFDLKWDGNDTNISDEFMFQTEDFSSFQCYTDYPIRPVFACAFMFTLIIYFLSIFSCFFHYFFAITLEGPTLSDYLEIFVRRAFFLGRSRTSNPQSEEPIMIKVKLKTDSNFRFIELPAKQKSYYGLVSSLKEEFSLNEEDGQIEIFLIKNNQKINSDHVVLYLENYDEIEISIQGSE